MKTLAQFAAQILQEKLDNANAKFFCLSRMQKNLVADAGDTPLSEIQEDEDLREKYEEELAEIEKMRQSHLDAHQDVEMAYKLLDYLKQ